MVHLFITLFYSDSWLTILTKRFGFFTLSKKIIPAFFLEEGDDQVCSQNYFLVEGISCYMLCLTLKVISNHA